MKHFLRTIHLSTSLRLVLLPLFVFMLLGSVGLFARQAEAATCPGGAMPVDGTTCVNNGSTTCVAGYTLSGGNCVPKTSGDSFASSARTCNSKPRFLGLVPWYEYLTLSDDGAGGCKINQFHSGDVLGTDTSAGKSASPFLLIGLAILQDLVRVAALVAVGFVIYGGFKYITSQGAPEDTKEAQRTIINALIGLAFAILAAGIVGFIGNKLG